MFDRRLLEVLCCPESRKALKMADAEILSKLNEGISLGTLKNLAGGLVQGPIEEALVTVDESRVYPIYEGIPVLLVDESISL